MQTDIEVYYEEYTKLYTVVLELKDLFEVLFSQTYGSYQSEKEKETFK